MDYILILLGYLRAIFITGLLGLLIYYLIHIGNRYVLEKEKFKIKRKHVLYFVLSVLSIMLIYFIFNDSSEISGLIMPVVTSIAFAYILNPFVNMLEKRGISRLLGVLIIYLLVIAIIVVMSFIIFPKMSQEWQNLMNQMPNYSESLEKFFDSMNNLYLQYSKNIEYLPAELQGIQDVITENLQKIPDALGQFAEKITKSIINMFSKLVGLVIIPILTFYFIKDKEYFKKKICLTIPKKFRADTFKVSREIDSVLGRFIRGQMIVGLFVGVTTVIGLAILGIDFALIIGILAGIANFIPFLGPIIGAIPAVFFALIEEPIKAIWVIILFIIIQQFESNILSPKIVGESVGLHPVVVIVVLLIGANVAGFLGMLLAVPATAVIKILFSFTMEKLTNI